MSKFLHAIQAILPELTAFRHDLHAHPETAYGEQRTSAKVREVLGKLPGLDVRPGLAGGNGIIATLNSDKAGPCVLLRADMDALPIAELSEVPYRSKHPGRMHACGHDGHTACLVGAARVLSRLADQLPGKIKFCFQPAEEDGAGGERMIEDGALDDPRVDLAFAIHCWPRAPLGQVLVKRGPMLAAASPFEIDFLGKGGHAAYPHEAADVLTAAAQFITSAQSIRTRFVDPLDPVVLSFCQIRGGETHNALPESCHVKGTIRALSESAHSTAKHLLRKFLQNTATSFEIQADLAFVGEYPVLYNDERCADLVADVATRIAGVDRVVTDFAPSMGGEDFAFYAQRVPAVMARVGLRPAGTFDYPALHSPRFNFNDKAIPTAVHLFCAVAQQFLSTPPPPNQSED